MTKPAAEAPSLLDAPLLPAVGLVAATGAALAFAFVGARAGISVAVGGLIGAANLWAITRIVRAFLPSEQEAENAKKGSAVGWGIFAVLKIAILFGGIWILWKFHAVDPLPLVLGYGALPVGISVGTLLPRRNAA